MAQARSELPELRWPDLQFGPGSLKCRTYDIGGYRQCAEQERYQYQQNEVALLARVLAALSAALNTRATWLQLAEFVAGRGNESD
jgi:hypothetical protein